MARHEGGPAGGGRGGCCGWVSAVISEALTLPPGRDRWTHKRRTCRTPAENEADRQVTPFPYCPLTKPKAVAEWVGQAHRPLHPSPQRGLQRRAAATATASSHPLRLLLLLGVGVRVCGPAAREGGLQRRLGARLGDAGACGEEEEGGGG